MKPAQVIMGSFFAIVALAAVAWIGKYDGQLPKAAVVTPPEKSLEELAPPISPEGPYPKAVVDNVEFDFGAMEHGTQANHTFQITNEGEAPLVLVKGASTCQCTVGEFPERDEVPPGESRPIKLSWVIKSEAPTYRQSVRMLTNDPDQKTIELVVRGAVQERVVISPGATLKVGEIRKDRPNVVEAAIHSGIVDNVELVESTTSNPKVTVVATPLDDAEKTEKKALTGVKLTITVAPDVPVGWFAERVMVKVKYKDAEGEDAVSEFPISVEGLRPGPIDIKGSGWIQSAGAVDLGRFPASEGKKGTLSLFVRDLEGDLVLQETVQKYNSVKVSLVKDEQFQAKTQRYVLTLEVPPGEPTHRENKSAERLDLKLNHPEMPEMRVYVQYLSQ